MTPRGRTRHRKGDDLGMRHREEEEDGNYRLPTGGAVRR